ncbi:MAG: hypothetical protein HOA30_14735 [Rhodospirillaceae bacterium]|nr:hypothetical protein [Rhodospirillaceae bacterium]MBT6885295.1 hypothetical protein [Rhodospirillaceae bacterium]
MKIFRAATPIILAATLLGACETSPPTQRLPEITFSHMPAFNVDVAKIEIENRFASKLSAPHIEHLMPLAPAAAVEQWAKDRVKAVGRGGTLRMIIEDASARETTLQKDTSFKGKLTKQQSHRYDMAVRATLELKDDSGKVLAAAGANASRSITAREDVTLNEREKIWFETVDLLMKDFNREMEANTKNYLGQWLR